MASGDTIWEVDCEVREFTKSVIVETSNWSAHLLNQETGVGADPALDVQLCGNYSVGDESTPSGQYPNFVQNKRYTIKIVEV